MHFVYDNEIYPLRYDYYKLYLTPVDRTAANNAGKTEILQNLPVEEFPLIDVDSILSGGRINYGIDQDFRDAIDSIKSGDIKKYLDEFIELEKELWG